MQNPCPLRLTHCVKSGIHVLEGCRVVHPRFIHNGTRQKNFLSLVGFEPTPKNLEGFCPDPLDDKPILVSLNFPDALFISVSDVMNEMFQRATRNEFNRPASPTSYAPHVSLH